MHPNPSFRKESDDQNIAFVRERAFGTLAVNASNGPLLSHIPFLLSEDAGVVELHLVRSNPILRLLEEPVDAAISVIGGDAYISPDWYEVDDQVPTWNYVAVHLRGTLRRLPQEQLHGVLSRLSASMEERLLPKKPWTSDKMDQNVYEKMQRQIMPVIFDVQRIDGTWKLSQNKPDDVRLRAAEGVKQNGIGSETELISQLMHDAKK